MALNQGQAFRRHDGWERGADRWRQGREPGCRLAQARRPGEEGRASGTGKGSETRNAGNRLCYSQHCTAQTEGGYFLFLAGAFFFVTFVLAGAFFLLAGAFFATFFLAVAMEPHLLPMLLEGHLTKHERSRRPRSQSRRPTNEHPAPLFDGLCHCSGICCWINAFKRIRCNFSEPGIPFERRSNGSHRGFPTDLQPALHEKPT